MKNDILHRVKIAPGRTELITDAEYRARINSAARHWRQWVWGWIFVGIGALLVCFIVVAPFIAMGMK